MPGAFAHMIAADKAKSVVENDGLEFPTKVLNTYPEWMQSGAAGPDYPYLHHALTSTDPSDDWADLFHYDRTGDVVRHGAEILKGRYAADAGSQDYMRACAWFFGYASHVVFDAGIHPLVRAIVGEYQDNKTDHRVCEMYMDAFIYKRTYDVELTNGEWADYLRSLNEGDGMDAAVVTLWKEMIERTYPTEFAANPPMIGEWHKAYVDKLDAADLNVGFFRHWAGSNGVLYVPVADIPAGMMEKYINSAALPANNRFNQATMHYRDAFDIGVQNIVRFWSLINDAITGPGAPDLPALPNWNLDTGTLIGEEAHGDATLWV